MRGHCHLPGVSQPAWEKGLELRLGFLTLKLHPPTQRPPCPIGTPLPHRKPYKEVPIGESTGQGVLYRVFYGAEFSLRQFL